MKKKIILWLCLLLVTNIATVYGQKMLDFTVYTKEGKIVTGTFQETRDLYPYSDFEYTDSLGVKRKIPATKALYARIGNSKYETRMGFSDYYNLIATEGQIRVLYRTRMEKPKDTTLILANLIIDQPDISKACYTVVKREELAKMFIEYPELYARYKFKRNGSWLYDVIEFNDYIELRK